MSRRFRCRAGSALLAWAALSTVACDSGKTQQELAACGSAKAQLEGEKSQLEERVHTLERSLDELQKRGNAIYSLEMRVSLPGVATPVATGTDVPAHFLTLGEWSAKDGSTYRFVGHNQAGSAAGADLTFTYEPVSLSELIARPIDLLQSVQTIQLDFPAALRVAGIDFEPASRLHLEVVVNGLTVVQIDSSAGEVAGRLRLEVTEPFGKIPQAYTEELQRRQSGKTG